jgi:hypothetical protein
LIIKGFTAFFMRKLDFSELRKNVPDYAQKRQLKGN